MSARIFFEVEVLIDFPGGNLRCSVNAAAGKDRWIGGCPTRLHHDGRHGALHRRTWRVDVTAETPQRVQTRNESLQFLHCELKTQTAFDLLHKLRQAAPTVQESGHLVPFKCKAKCSLILWVSHYKELKAALAPWLSYQIASKIWLQELHAFLKSKGRAGVHCPWLRAKALHF